MSFQKSSSVPPIAHPVDVSAYHAKSAVPRGHPDFVMSRSALRAFAKCPHRWVAGHEEEDSAAMEDGSLADVITLTPERFDSLYAVCPETYPSAAKKGVVEDKPWNWNATFCKDWRAAREAEGKTTVKHEAVADAMTARAALFKNDHIAAFFAASKRQVLVNVEWHDDETGIFVPVKCLIDLVPDPGSEFGDTLADFKRTNDASYSAWTRTVHKFSLAEQASFYLDAINAATSSKYRCFEHHIQESFPPWESTYRMLDDEFITIGRTAYQRNFSTYCMALKSGVWRGYDSAIVSPESWMLKDL